MAVGGLEKARHVRFMTPAAKLRCRPGKHMRFGAAMRVVATRAQLFGGLVQIDGCFHFRNEFTVTGSAQIPNGLAQEMFLA